MGKLFMDLFLIKNYQNILLPFDKIVKNCQQMLQLLVKYIVKNKEHHLIKILIT